VFTRITCCQTADGTPTWSGVCSLKPLTLDAARWQVKDFCFITENTYSHDDVRGMELEILSALDFQLTVPTIRTFLRRFVKASAATFPGGAVDSRCFQSPQTLNPTPLPLSRGALWTRGAGF